MRQDSPQSRRLRPGEGLNSSPSNQFGSWLRAELGNKGGRRRPYPQTQSTDYPRNSGGGSEETKAAEQPKGTVTEGGEDTDGRHVTKDARNRPEHGPFSQQHTVNPLMEIGEDSRGRQPPEAEKLQRLPITAPTDVDSPKSWARPMDLTGMDSPHGGAVSFTSVAPSPLKLCLNTHNNLSYRHPSKSPSPHKPTLVKRKRKRIARQLGHSGEEMLGLHLLNWQWLPRNRARTHEYPYLKFLGA